MRVTNKMLSNNFLSNMRKNLTNMSTIQDQMSSGKQIRKPSDDPFKASRIMQMHSEIDANKQYNNNIKDSINWLDTTDTSLGQVGDALGRVEELLISTGNPGYGSNQRQAIRDEINQIIGGVSQILNTSFDGKYIFGGTSGTSKPVEVGTNSTLENTNLICNVKPKTVGKIISNVMTYTGETVDAGSEFNIYLNGSSMKITTTADIEKNGTMAAAAGNLQIDINTTIEAANAQAGKISGDDGFIEPITVEANEDGRFEIISPSGIVAFSATAETKKLGLSEGTDLLLVEVSQGVTMDYNITASQVINYGSGTNNLMELFKNITNHLNSMEATDIQSLTTTDLEGIKNAMTNVLKLRSTVGAKQNSMESAQNRNVDQNFNMTEILARTEDIDITEKIMEFASMQTIYMASLQTSARVLQPTLLDYLR
jgi:flagellar hook-associated protein 3 FlgL